MAGDAQASVGDAGDVHDDVIVYIPPAMRSLSGGARSLSASGRTVREVVDDLESRWPGFRETLIEDDRLRRGLWVAVNSEQQPLGLLAGVPPGAELHILPAMSGGQGTRSRR